MALGGDSIDWRRYFFLFLRGWWVIALIVGLSLLGSWLWLQRQTPVYAAVATVEVERKEAKILPDIQNLKDETMDSLFDLNTAVQNLTSNDLLLAAIASSGIGREAPFSGLGADGQPLPDVVKAGMLRQMVSVSLRRGSRLIDVTVEHPKPAVAEKIASALVEGFRDQKFRKDKRLHDDVSGGLEGKADELKAQMEQAIQAKDDYRAKHPEAVSAQDQLNIVSDKLKAINTELTAFDSKMLGLSADLDQLKKADASKIDELLNIPSVAQLASVSSAVSAVQKAEADFAALKKRYLERHPAYIAAETQIRELRRVLEQSIRSADTLIRQQYDAAAATHRALQESLEAQKQKAVELSRINAPYDQLVATAERLTAEYDKVIGRVNELSITNSVGRISPYSIVNSPLASNLPVRPNKTSTMLKALALSLAAALGLIFLFDRLDSSLRTVDQAEAELELGALAALPDAGKKMEGQAGLVMLGDGGSSAAEAFRTLRASLSLLGEEASRRLLLVTSAVPAEGKTYTSVNLAIALARQGFSTLLIDCDLRRPQVSTILMGGDAAARRDALGMSDLLAGLATVDQTVRPTDVDNLFALTAGRRAPNPAELLAQPKLAALLKEFLSRFDRVVIDSAPVNAVSDTLAVAPHVHAVCLVVRSGKTPRKVVARALKQLQQTGARIAGFVLNRVPTGRSAGYYYYYYGDPYVKDGVYGSQPATRS